MSVSTSISRRQLFRSFASSANSGAIQPIALRPPGAVTADFVERCTQCGECLRACPEQIIIKGAGGFPELSFSESGCIGCSDCIEVCPTSALVAVDKPWPHGQWLLNDQECFHSRGISCQSCKDACDVSAIQFPMRQSMPSPQLNADACTACGACISVCPANAIQIQPLIQTGEEKRPHEECR